MSQQTKTFIATIGPASTPDGTMTPAEFDSTLYQKYLSVGYTVLISHYVGEHKGEDGRIQGVRILVILVRDYEDKKPAKEPEKKEEPKAPEKTQEVIEPK